MVDAGEPDFFAAVGTGGDDPVRAVLDQAAGVRAVAADAVASTVHPVVGEPVVQLGQHFLRVGRFGLVEHVPGSAGRLGALLLGLVVEVRLWNGLRPGGRGLQLVVELVAEFVEGLVEELADGRVAGGVVDLGELEAATADVLDEFGFRRHPVLRQVESDGARPQPGAVGVPGARHRGGPLRVELVLFVFAGGEHDRCVLQVLAQRRDVLGRDRLAVGDHRAAMLVVVVEDVGHLEPVGRFGDPRLRDRRLGDSGFGVHGFGGCGFDHRCLSDQRLHGRLLGGRCFGGLDRGAVEALLHPVRHVLLGARVATQFVDVRGTRQRALPEGLGIEVDVDPIARWTFDDVEGTEPGAHVGPVHAFAQALEDLLQFDRRLPGAGTAVLRGNLTQQVVVLTGGAVLHRDLLPVLGSAL